MTKQKSARYPVEYDTKWIHYDLDPQQALYFKAKTPIPEIISQLETTLNQNGPEDITVDYKTRSRPSNFSRLYRNLARSYKGWYVLYRKPGSKTDYEHITEQIGSQEKVKNTQALRQTLRRSMVWKHHLDPAIKPVQINKAESCQSIAKQLNHQFQHVSVNQLLQKWLPSFDELKQNGYKLVEQNLNLGALTNKNQTWQRFLHSLQTVNDCSKQLRVSNSTTDYKISHHHIYNVLMSNSKTAKGWRVEFLDGSTRAD